MRECKPIHVADRAVNIQWDTTRFKAPTLFMGAQSQTWTIRDKQASVRQEIKKPVFSGEEEPYRRITWTQNSVLLGTVDWSGYYLMKHPTEILSKDSRTPVRPPDVSQCWGYRTQAGTMFHILTLHKKLILRTSPECCRKCGKPERLIKLSE